MTENGKSPAHCGMCTGPSLSTNPSLIENASTVKCFEHLEPSRWVHGCFITSRVVAGFCGRCGRHADRMHVGEIGAPVCANCCPASRGADRAAIERCGGILG